jgi:hypothetical protein
MRQSWIGPREVQDLVLAARSMDARAAARMEDGLTGAPDLEEDRVTLLAYSARVPDALALRLRQISWLAEHDPDHPILAWPLAVPTTARHGAGARGVGEDPADLA